jgi:hypothetical protein
MTEIPKVECIEFPMHVETVNNVSIEERLTLYKDSFQLHFGPVLHPVLGTSKPTMKLWLHSADPNRTDLTLKAIITKQHTFSSMADFQPINQVEWKFNDDTASLSLEDKIYEIASRIFTCNGPSSTHLCDPPLYSPDSNPRSLADFYFNPQTAGSGRPSRQNIPWFCYFTDNGTIACL